MICIAAKSSKDGVEAKMHSHVCGRNNPFLLLELLKLSAALQESDIIYGDKGQM